MRARSSPPTARSRRPTRPRSRRWRRRPADAAAAVRRRCRWRTASSARGGADDGAARRRRRRRSRCTSASPTASTCEEQLAGSGHGAAGELLSGLAGTSRRAPRRAGSRARQRRASVRKRLERVDPPFPRVVGGRLDARCAEARSQLRRRRADCASAVRDRLVLGGRHQAVLAVAAEVAVAVRVGADDGAAPVAIASSGGSAKPSCDGGLDEDRGVVEELVDLLVARASRRSASPARPPSSGSMPNRHSSGPRLRQRAPRGDRQRQVLQRVRAAERQHHVLAGARPPRAGGTCRGRCPAGSARRRVPSSRSRSRFQEEIVM